MAIEGARAACRVDAAANRRQSNARWRRTAARSTEPKRKWNRFHSSLRF